MDAAGLDLFRGAAVYPYILIWEKKRASAQHRVSLIRTDYDGQQLRVTRRLLVPQASSQRKPAFGSMRLWHSKRAFLAFHSGSTPSCIAGQPGLSPMNSGDGLSKQRHPRATLRRVRAI